MTPLMMVLLLAISAGALGSWGLLRRWRSLVQTQVNIDHCVARTALELKHTLTTIGQANKQILALRASEAATSILPPAQAIIQAALQAEVLRQELALTKWGLKQIPWLTRRGCPEDQQARGLPLPVLRYFRAPQDSLGPQPLIWKGAPPKSFSIQLSHPLRRAAARIERKPSPINPDWSVKWDSPLSITNAAKF